MPEPLHPPAIVGQWVRLRPIGRSDHGWLYARRISPERSRFNLSLPTFEEWAARELTDMLGAGLVLVVENLSGHAVGLERLYKVSTRDRRAYVEMWLDGAISDLERLEAGMTFLEHCIAGLNFRKLYVELPASDTQHIDLVRMFGFAEEVRQTDYLWVGTRFDDIVHLSLDSATWLAKRGHLITTLTVSTVAARGHIT
jgi:hypothetical protein